MAEKLSITAILDFLGREKIRATYGAVAGVLGTSPQSIGRMLGDRRPEVSWVVNAKGCPTGYVSHEMHPDLFSKGEIIATSGELLERMRGRS